MHDAVAWEHGDREERAAYLAAARRADPDGARSLLAVDWPALPPDERAQLLAVLAAGLGPGDEVFLEQALDDRRKEVRTVAAELLGTLPGSAYRRRMARRARRCLRRRGDGRLVVVPPEGDDGMRRDGIDPKPRSGGQRAWWLEQLLARTPLPTWTSTSHGTPLAASPAEILALPIADDWAPVVHRGLARAAAAQRNSAWASALLDVLEPLVAPMATGQLSLVVKPLYRALSPDAVVRRAIAALEDDGARLGRLIEELLASCPVPWPDPLADAVLRGFSAHARHRRMPYSLDNAFELAAFRLPPHRAADADRMAQRLRAGLPGHGGVHTFEVLASRLHLRHEMIQEIA
jgi:hypothetical protein